MLIENGVTRVDPNCCRDDGDPGLDTFLTGYCSTIGCDEAADNRILQLLLNCMGILP